MYGLYDYQIEAVKNLRSGSILCGGVGSGKSRTALAYFIDSECGGFKDGTIDLSHKKPLFIITTARKRDSLEWDGDMVPFCLSRSDDSATSVTIDSWNNVAKYKNVKDAFFIFDEQRVVGSGKWSKSFIQITKHNHWILLSATPGDTWSDYIPVFIANGFYRNRSEFLYKHCVFDRFSKYPKIIKYVGVDELVRHRDSILVTMDFERTVKTKHEYIYCSYDSSRYINAVKRRWNDETQEPFLDASSLCYFLRKIANSDSSRLTALRKIFDNHKKIIVFYNFDYELELIKNEFKENVAEYNGHKHEALPKTDFWLYLVQYSAGAEGWNCIETNVVVFFSQSYSYKMTVQAAGRIDRLNTSFDKLLYYHLISKAPIDLAIKKCIGSKRNFNENSFMKKQVL